jgi:hypothetical protein
MSVDQRKSGRVDHTLNATGAGSHNIDFDATDFAAFAAPLGREQWIANEILPH